MESTLGWVYNILWQDTKSKWLFNILQPTTRGTTQHNIKLETTQFREARKKKTWAKVSCLCLPYAPSRIKLSNKTSVKLSGFNGSLKVSNTKNIKKPWAGNSAGTHTFSKDLVMNQTSFHEEYPLYSFHRWKCWRKSHFRMVRSFAWYLLFRSAHWDTLCGSETQPLRPAFWS